MFWELYQQSEIQAARVASSRAEARAGSAQDRMSRVERRLEALSLACQSMWELCSAEFKLSEEQLIAKMQEVDLRDGKLDGRMSPQAQECERCNRRANARRDKCLYCGHEFAADGHLFDV